MQHFDNLVEATQALKKEGYDHEFTLKRDRIYCEDLNNVRFNGKDLKFSQV